MFKFLVALLLTAPLFSQALNDIKDKRTVKILIYNVARTYGNSVDEALTYTEVIPECAEIYGLNPVMLMRQGVKESWLNRYACQSNGEMGWAQIIPKNWGWTLHEILGTNYQARDYYRYFFDIRIQGLMFGYIMKRLLKEAHGDYPLALVAYNYGPNSWWRTYYFPNNYNKMRDLYYWRIVYEDTFFMNYTMMHREKLLDENRWINEIESKVTYKIITPKQVD